MRVIFACLMLLIVTPSFSIETNCVPGSASQTCNGGAGSGGTGGTGGTPTSCTVTSFCYTGSLLTGSVSCTGTSCARGIKPGTTIGYVVCDGSVTEC